MKKNGLQRYTHSERKGIAILVSIIILVNLISVISGSRATPEVSGFLDEVSIAGNNLPQPEDVHVPLLEINTADSIALLELKGIGPVYSRRIIKYRNLLGGYHDTQQLLEVYGMDSIRLSGFIGSISVDPSSLKKINLRTAQFKEILRHPYISYEMVKSYVNYRDRIGPPDEVKIIWESSIWPDSLFTKLNPYLSVGK